LPAPVEGAAALENHMLGGASGTALAPREDAQQAKAALQNPPKSPLVYSAGCPAASDLHEGHLP
jgi:hypothetical protein